MNGVEIKENIIISNASVNNLKNINVSIPINAFTCVTGVSGCGKSSLVYDTIYAESQRDFLESMSGNMYGQKLMDKPQVDNIENLRPALSVSQNYYNHNPRSTVGTLTDISHFLRAMFAMITNFELNTNYNESYFSSNNPSSSCGYCHGLGEEYDIEEDLVVPDPSKKLIDGAIVYYKGKDNSYGNKLLMAICEYFKIDPMETIDDLTDDDLYNLLYRKEKIELYLKFKTPKGRYKQQNISVKGAIVELKDKLEEIDSPSTYASISKYLIRKECSKCKGTRLKEEVLEKKICGNSIADVESLMLPQVLIWMEIVKEKYRYSSIYRQIEQLAIQIAKRIKKMIDLKVDYISIDRSVPTLSGGEIQRIRIANQLNCSLKGLIYILDEPCRGLHSRNIESIITATKELIDRGNTVIAIEHDKQYISSADKIIELGPVGGPKGGYILSENKPISEYSYNIFFKEKSILKKYIELINISYRNIYKQSVKIPLGVITCITGVSGSGKSTLVSVIEQCIEKRKNIYCDEIKGMQYIKKVLRVNQRPIGKTPRSTVVSYLEVYDNIRDIFAKCDEAKKLGLSASDFSMNVKGGRCECCQGTGFRKIELNYLPDSYIICNECNGVRFQEKILETKYKGMTISDILDTPIESIINLFCDNNLIYEKLKCMIEIGLGYIKLGQMSMNLSGGEAQRIKLVKALGTKTTGKNLFILDEPTSGLNSSDIDIFCNILLNLQKQGETIVIIEHNIEFITKVADYMVDFGILAGDEGGKIVAQGFPKYVYESLNSSWNKY